VGANPEFSVIAARVEKFVTALPVFQSRSHFSVWAWCPLEMTMTLFCLLCSGLRTSIPEYLLDELRALPGVRIKRVTSIVSLYFDGTEAELHALLAPTAWSAFHVSESRTYRLQ
jgi:hypothetical protein